MDYEVARNLVSILEDSISYSNQLKSILIRTTDSTSDSHYRIVKFDYDNLTDHINKCSSEIIRIKDDERKKWEQLK